MSSRLHAILLISLAALMVSGCRIARNDPTKATRRYPAELHRAEAVDMQVFRDNTELEIVNSTPVSYFDFDLWINQRWVAPVAALPAGQTIRLSLWNFYDVYGDVFEAGGLFRTGEPMPVRLVEIQQGGEGPMIGLITIRAEEAD